MTTLYIEEGTSDKPIFLCDAPTPPVSVQPTERPSRFGQQRTYLKTMFEQFLRVSHLCSEFSFNLFHIFIKMMKACFHFFASFVIQHFFFHIVIIGSIIFCQFPNKQFSVTGLVNKKLRKFRKHKVFRFHLVFVCCGLHLKFFCKLKSI